MTEQPNFGKDRFADMKPAGALQRLSERSKGSRLSVLIIAIIGLFVFAFVIGLVVKGFSGGINRTPDVPRVDIR